MNTKWVKGSDLDWTEQQSALRRFVHRYTGNHRPAWSRAEWKDGKEYPLQFADDADWLANTRFAVTKSGKLHRGVRHCESNPTWPNSPELRRVAA